MNYPPGVGWIARPVDLQSSVLQLSTYNQKQMTCVIQFECVILTRLYIWNDYDCIMFPDDKSSDPE